MRLSPDEWTFLTGCGFLALLAPPAAIIMFVMGALVLIDKRMTEKSREGRRQGSDRGQRRADPE